MEKFGELISPVSVDEFLANYWEKTFLHVRNEHGKNDHGRFSDYFTLRDVDLWLTSGRGRLVIAPPKDSDGRTEEHDPQDINTSIVYAAFASGCSLVLEPMEDWPPLMTLVASLGRDFHAAVGARAFLTPEAGRPFPVHVAGCDVLVLQLEGEKTWHLHEPRLLQVNPSQKKTFNFPVTWYGRTKTPVMSRVCLEPGDVLFIPRGMPYQAVDQKGACLYLLFEITPLFWMDFLRVAVEYAALHSEELRKALPPGFVDDDEICERMRQTFRDAMNAFEKVTSFDAVLASVKRNRLRMQRFPPDGHFAQLMDIEGVAADSFVERRRDILCAVDEYVDVERNRKCAIYFGKERVIGPLHLRRALEFVRDHSLFRVSEIPGLDPQGQVVLARRLISEGLLRRVLTARPVEVSEAAVT